MKNLRYSLVAVCILATGLGMSGCGGGSNRSDMSVAPHMTPDSFDPVQHIGNYSRDLDQKAFDPDQIEWEYDNQEGLRMNLDDTMLYLDFTYNQQLPNIQFFLNTDNNTNTGNLEEGGAEYMVENGYLYRATDPKKWKWEEVAKLTSSSQEGKRYSVAIKRSDLKNMSVVFGVNAQALDKKWKPKVISPIDGSFSLYTAKNGIDWESVKTYTTNGDKVVKVFDTKELLYVYLEQNKRTEHIQIYIDSDNSAATGYHDDSWSDFGRDFLVEDGELYRYTGVGDWGWESIASVQRTRSNDGKDILEVAIPKDKLSLAADIKIGVETNNKSWNDTVLIPEGDIPHYHFGSVSVAKTIHISEVMAANTRTVLDPDYNNFSDWIELYNPHDTAVDLGGYSISDKLNKPKWKIPEGTTIAPHGYLTLWADNKDKAKQGLHTNFKLKMDGEAVAFFDPAGKLIEGFEYTRQKPDISIAMQNGKTVYMTPTPGLPNATAHASAILAKKPTFSLSEGMYDQPQTLTLKAENQATIYYTTDGSTPTVASSRYNGPISIDHSMSVRAISVEKGKFTSEIVTGNYLIGENIDIPVVSIAIDDKYLNDDQIGIYTVGSNGKKIRDCGEEAIKANYNQKWERPAHMTLFESNHKPVLSQDIGLKIAGECSRHYQQKSFQLKADDKYGKGKFKYQVFPDKPIKKYERLKLRNAGQDFIKTHMRDALQQMLVKDQMHVIYEAYRPAILFVNGEFWGVYSLREKLGKEYLEENFGEKKVNLLEDDRIVEEGSSEEYDDLVTYLQNHSLTSDENYNYVASQIDIDNYIDYMIANIYVANADWPGTNLVYWKPQKKGTKWQWILHDMDYGFGRYSESPVTYNALAAAIAVGGPEWPNPEWSTLLLRKLLENDGFKAQFKSRFLNRIDTTFNSARVKKIIDTMQAQIAPYISRHIARWTIDGEYSYAVNSKADWEDEVDKLRDFADQRPAIVKSHIQQQLQ